MKTFVFALHGFLGSANDWHEVFTHIHHEQPSWETIACNVNYTQSPEQFIAEFIDLVESVGPGRKTLMGYSLGGRIALQIAHKKPALWDGLVFLSTNPGLQDNADRVARLQSDQQWAKRFRSEPLVDVLQDWNQQPALQTSAVVDRSSNRATGEELAAGLENWTLARQQDFRPLLDLWPAKQIWAAGDRDEKFVKLLKTLPLTDDLQKWVVEDVGHRLIFESPQEVAHFALRISQPIPENPVP